MRKMGILNKLNYQAGLLNDGAAVEEVVVTPDEQAELIADSAENITNPEVAETEVLLNEIVAEDEVISEELAEVQEEQEVVAEGLQSDFTAVTTRNMIKSIERINARYGEGSILTAGMQSDRFGGHKDLYVAGLQAKENFLKNAAKNVWALIQSMIQKIKELAQKAMVFLNNDKKAAEKLLGIIKKKGKTLKEGVEKELSDKEIEAIGNKFGAWLSVGGTLADYPETLKKFLLNPIEISLETKTNPETDEQEDSLVIDASSVEEMNKKFKSNKMLKDIDGEVYALAVIGKTIKYVVEKDGSASINSITVTEDDYKAKIEKAIPGIDLLESHVTTAIALATELKKYADKVYKGLDDISLYIKKNKKETGESYAAAKKATILKSQAAMATISGYTATQKSMIWFAGAFVNKYNGPDATAADKATTEDKK